MMGKSRRGINQVLNIPQRDERGFFERLQAGFALF